MRRKIERLGEIGAPLETVIAACPGQGGQQACSILDALVESDAAIKAFAVRPQHSSLRRAALGLDRFAVAARG